MYGIFPYWESPGLEDEKINMQLAMFNFQCSIWVVFN